MAARPIMKLNIGEIVPGYVHKVEEPITPSEIAINIVIELNELDSGFIYTIENAVFGQSKDNYKVSKSINGSTNYPFISYIFDGKYIGRNILLDFRYTIINNVLIKGKILNTISTLSNPNIEIIEINKNNLVQIIGTTQPNINGEYNISLDIKENCTYKLRAFIKYIG